MRPSNLSAASKLSLCLSLVLLFTGQVFAQLTVTDDAGHLVELKQPARRIVSLAPHITENLFALGAGQAIVGTVRFSDFPEAAKAIPIIGSYKEISYESLLRLNPDLVVAWLSGNEEEMIARIKALGLTVYLDEPRSIDDIPDTLLRLGVLTGQTDAATIAASDYRERLHALRKDYREEERPGVFYQVWNDPLTTLNGEHLISDIIRFCGGYNVFADAIPLAPIINLESVFSVDPDVIIVSGMGEEQPEWLNFWRRWPHLSAVAENRLFYVHPDLIQRNSVRNIAGIETVCAQLASVRDAR